MTLILQQLSHHHLIQNVDHSYEPGRIYGILGPNGAGKSTLLKTICGIWNPTSGKVLWNNTDLHALPRHQISRILTLVPQSPQLQFDMTVQEMVALGRYPHGEGHPSSHVVLAALEHVDGIHLKQAMMSELSGGEKQRIYLARALATQAPVLLLDEPASHLDLRHHIDIWTLLHRLAKEGKTILTTLHDLSMASRQCHHIQIIHQGHSVASGFYKDVMTPALLREVFSLHESEIT